MSRFSKKVSAVLGNNPLLKQLLDSTQQNSDLLKEIQSLVPSSLSPHCIAARYTGDHITLFTDSAAWASRLRFHSREICQYFVNYSRPVKRLNVRVIPKTQTGRKKNIRRQAKSLSANSARLIRETADSITDPELQAALRRLARHQQITGS